MSGDTGNDRDRAFAALVEQFLREMSASVGPDKILGFVRETAVPDGEAEPRIAIRTAPPDTSPFNESLEDHPEVLPSGQIDPGHPTVLRSIPENRVNAEYPVWYGTNRRPILSNGQLTGFSAERDGETHYGQCRVFVPESHKIGSTGSGFWKLPDHRTSIGRRSSTRSMVTPR